MSVGYAVLGNNLEVILAGKFTAREADEAIASGLRWSQTGPVRLLLDVQHPAVACAGALPASEVLGALRPRLAHHCAIVVSDDVAVGAANEVGRRMASFGMEVGAFRDVAAARTWLDEVETGG
jgi:hypothetical protein